MRALTRLTERWDRWVARARTRSGLVDHVWRAKERYDEVLAGRLAAAISYYGFFAVFALALIGYSVLGFLVQHRLDLSQAVDEFLAQNLPVVDTAEITAGRGTAGVAGLIGLVLAGVGWVEALRSSQRLIWQLEQQPGNPLLRRLSDLLALLLLALLLGGSFGLALGLEWLLSWSPQLARTALAVLLAVGVNLVLAVTLLVGLPRLRISARRLLPPALLVAVGLYGLNTLGQLYVDRVRANPAYAVVATAAGVLVYLYAFNQILLAGAALAATSSRGRVVDLTAKPQPSDQ